MKTIDLSMVIPLLSLSEDDKQRCERQVYINSFERHSTNFLSFSYSLARVTEEG